MAPSNHLRMRLRTLFGAVLALLVAAAWSAAPAFAAPVVLSSDPEPGETLLQAPGEVSITFSEPLQDESRMQVRDECGKRVDDGAVDIELNDMSVGIARKPRGEYTVVYAAVGVSGSTSGGYVFTVQAGPACDGGTGGHEGHDGGGGDDGSGDPHGGHGGGGDGDDHDGTEHGRAGTHPGDHAQGDHAQRDNGRHQASGHKGDDRDGKHGDHHRQADEGNDGDEGVLAGGPTSAPATVPTGASVLVALGLASAMGALGGWVLRVSQS